MASRPADIPATLPTDRSEGTRAAPRRRYFPCFEGLRALAAGAVVVYHSVTLVGRDAAGTAYTPVAVLDMGVSVFFVISGFLLYRPFVAAAAEGRPAIGPLRFWWRRVLRIVPAYWFALSVLWALGWVELGAEPWRYYLFLQIYDAYTTLGGIVPAWSLNTEMSFYLFLPFWAVLMRRVLGRGRPTFALEAAGAVGLIALAYVSRAVMSGVDRVWAVSDAGAEVTMREVSFSWLPNTLDLFGLGMLLAVLSVWAGRDERLRAWCDRVAQPAGLWWVAAAGVWLGFAYGWGEPSLNGGYQGGYWQVRQAAFGLVAVCLLVPAVFGDQDRGLVRAALRSRTVVWVGALSYGLYLWHLDILQQVPGWLDRPAAEVPVLVLVAAAFGLGLLAASVSWYLLEKPLQALRRDGPAVSVVPPEVEAAPAPARA
ncbi:acyltransferase [Iamia majanohamensis]|uniref:Acyltransferase n=1 Tax=Iamia majanohamensis TaxID=467976 RepID=A0AAE9Y386_9ACTN|nr:acyltransferase [Iamia majanohamensis]WCO65074.1 acyltransferase [Iamia majanohamensis]